jgi:hypothetical protein
VRLDVVYLHLDRTTHRRYRRESLGQPAGKSRHLSGDKSFFLKQPRDHDANSESFDALIVTTLPFLAFPAGSSVF